MTSLGFGTLYRCVAMARSLTDYRMPEPIRDRIMIAREPEGRLLGWAMCAAYENVLDRFGPFGVIPEARGTGLGEILLHLTLERMVALGAHNAWFLWTGAESPAGHLYRKTGFTITRTFTIMKATL